MTELTETEKVHAWQRFRERCVELAVKSNVTPDNVVTVAKEIAEYILTKDARETPPAKEDPE